MAYATKYLFKFQSANGTTREIRVLKDGYSGSVLQRALGRAPILKKQKNGTVFGTSLEFYAECKVDGEFAEFYTTDPKAYKVQLYAGNDKLWEGFVTPELYAEPDIAPPYDVQVIATDGVGELKLYDFAAQGSKTLRQMFTYLLGYTGVGTDVYLISSMKAGSSGAGALLEKTINLDYMVGKNCYEVLTYLLDTLHATISWWKGAWIVARETNVTFQNGKVKYFNTAGNAAQLAGSVVTLGKMYSNDAWPVGQLTQKVDPAKKSVTVQAPWHPVTCLVNSDMDSDTGWTKTNNAAYNSSKKAYNLPDNYPSGGVATIAQNVAMGGLRVPMSFSGKFCATEAPESWAIYGGIAGVGIKYVTSGSVSYYLAQDSEGSPQWVQGTLTGNTDFQIRLSSVDTDEINAETLEFEIPALAVGSSFPAGTLTFEIVGRAALVFNAYLDVTLPKGYQDRLHLDNGARGEGDTVEIAIGRETSDIDYYKAFLQGILLDSGSLITSFKDDALTTATDFLSYISRDYARSFALPRIVRTGKVGLESAVTFPPLVFTKGAIDYWVETWGWDMYEDELDISARSLPTATITVESEVISEATGTTPSSPSSGGSSSSIQPGGANYFELSGSDVQLKSAYEKLILPVLQVTGNTTIGGTLGVTGAATLSSTLAVTGLATLSGGISLGGTYNSQDSKLVWDATNNAWHLIGNFYADGFVSAGGVSSGGGASGIDLRAMWNSLQNNDNADTSTTAKIHNYHLPACGTGLSYTLDANGMATNLNLNLSSSLVTTALGYTPVNPSSLGTMAYASTGDYVAKSGDTMTGVLTISRSNTSTSPNASFKSGTSNISYMELVTSDNKVAQFGYMEGASWGVADKFGMYIYANNGSQAGGLLVGHAGLFYTNGGSDFDQYTVYHSGNFIAGTNYQSPIPANTYAPYNAYGYLPLNGGTLSSSGQILLALDTTSSSGTGIQFKVGNTTKAEVGFWSTYAYLYNPTAGSEIEVRDDKTFMFTAPNSFLSSNAKLQLMRPDSTSYTDRACIGVTDGNLHIDSYPNHEIYLNYYSGGTDVHIGSYHALHTGNYSTYLGSVYHPYGGSTSLDFVGDDIYAYGSIAVQNVFRVTASSSSINNPVKIGYPTFSWDGSGQGYSLLYSEASNGDIYTMMAGLHLVYLENGKRGYTGNTRNATVRMESSADDSGRTYWDMGLLAKDEYSVSRAGTKYLIVMNDGRVYNTSTYSFTSWERGTMAIGIDSYDKVVLGQLSGYAWIGSHNYSLTQWASLRIAGSELRFMKDGSTLDGILRTSGKWHFGTATPADGNDVIPFAVANAGYSTSGWCASFGTSSGGVLAGYRSAYSAAVIGASGAGDLWMMPDGGCLYVGGGRRWPLILNRSYDASGSYYFGSDGDSSANLMILNNSGSTCALTLANSGIAYLSGGLNLPGNIVAVSSAQGGWSPRIIAGDDTYGGVAFLGNYSNGGTTFKPGVHSHNAALTAWNDLGLGGYYIYFYCNGSTKGYIDVSGNLVIYGAVTAGSASDARFKDNVRTMTDAKDVIMSLRPVRFTWNELARSKSEQYIGDDLGFIAQEVQPLVPQAVSSIYEEYLRVDSTKFIAPLVSVAQDHELRIRELEAKCARLEAENNELKRLNAN